MTSVSDEAFRSLKVNQIAILAGSKVICVARLIDNFLFLFFLMPASHALPYVLHAEMMCLSPKASSHKGASQKTRAIKIKS